MAALEREIRLHRRLRELLLLFSRGISSTLNLATALETVAIEVAQMVGASRRDRLAPRSPRARARARPPRRNPPSTGAAGFRPTTRRIAAARGLRLDRPERSDGVLIAPLRGWRRALGTLVLDRRGSGELDEAQLVEFAHELGHQLSVGIENVQLLEDILRQRRLLEDTFNSLVDLVAVIDNDCAIVQTNDAFASRVGLTRAEIIGRPLARAGRAEDTALWVETADDRHGPAAGGHAPRRGRARSAGRSC